jgi:hypothetical protein
VRNIRSEPIAKRITSIVSTYVNLSTHSSVLEPSTVLPDGLRMKRSDWLASSIVPDRSHDRNVALDTILLMWHYVELVGALLLTIVFVDWFIYQKPWRK